MKMKKMLMKRNAISIIIAFTIVISLFGFSGVRGACFDAEAAENGSISDVQRYSLGSYESGSITENGPDKQYYLFSLPESGEIHITGQAAVKWVYLRVYDSSGEDVWNVNLNWNSTSEIIPIDETIVLTSGQYYFCVQKDNGYGNYSFKMDFTPCNETFNETEGGSNNTLQTANTVSPNGTTYTAQIANNDEKDFWQFNLSESGRINFKATFYGIKWVYWKLYDENGEELLSKNPSQNSTTNNIVVDEKVYLTSGRYYISVSRDNGNGKYDFSIDFKSAHETYHEVNGGSNNTIQNASDLVIGQTYSGSIDLNDKVDFYRLSLSASATYTINLKSDAEWLRIKLFDANGNELWDSNPSSNSTTGNISFSRQAKLESATYYLAVEEDRDGDYSLVVSQLTQANCPHEEYDSVWHDATYFEKGYREYTCKACGYSYKADYTDKKILGQVSSYIARTPIKKGVRLSWYSVSDATGYQIRYSKSRSMSSATKIKRVSSTSTTIKNLSRKKKYYIQIRAYVKSGGKTAYGKWSSKVICKTK